MSGRNVDRSANVIALLSLVLAVLFLLSLGLDACDANHVIPGAL